MHSATLLQSGRGHMRAHNRQHTYPFPTHLHTYPPHMRVNRWTALVCFVVCRGRALACLALPVARFDQHLTSAGYQQAAGPSSSGALLGALLAMARCNAEYTIHYLVAAWVLVALVGPLVGPAWWLPWAFVGVCMQMRRSRCFIYK